MEDNLSLPISRLLEKMQYRIMEQTTYFGIRTLKGPLDFWVYQEIIWQTKPDFIVEIGNFYGGSALALAHLCDAMGRGKLICCDLDQKNIPAVVRSHPRITLVEGDACQSFDRINQMIEPGAGVLVIEDSAHSYDNTLAVLRTYSPLIRPGGYFIVEDSICHHGLPIGPRPGPYDAIKAFLAENTNFESDRAKESYLITWNPTGYLRRK
jgi:cephalosporin hydroxylase